MNYRKRKKFWTKILDKLSIRLRRNPLDARACSQFNYVLKQLKELKNDKRAKKDAKGKKLSCSFGHEA